MEKLLKKEYTSSKESNFEEIIETPLCFSKKMTNMKERLDKAYLGTLMNHAQGAFKDRVPGADSTRPHPHGPEWAVWKETLTFYKLYSCPLNVLVMHGCKCLFYLFMY